MIHVCFVTKLLFLVFSVTIFTCFGLPLVTTNALSLHLSCSLYFSSETIVTGLQKGSCLSLPAFKSDDKNEKKKRSPNYSPC